MEIEIDINENDMQEIGGVSETQPIPPIQTMQELKDSKVPTQTSNDPIQGMDEEMKVMKVVGKIQSAAFGGFTKILSFLAQGTSSQDIIYIKEGKLNLVKNAGYIFCDLSIMFDDNNLEIIDPTKSIKLLSLIKGGDEVLFLKDDSNSRYLISNLVDDKVSTTVSLPQPDHSVNIEVSAPEIGELKFRQELAIDFVDNIQSAIKALESQYLKLELVIEDDSFDIVSISTSDDIFKQELIHTQKETKIFKIFNPFPITKPDEFYFEVHQREDELWVKTISYSGMVNIEYLEKIEEESEFDTFSL